MYQVVSLQILDAQTLSNVVTLPEGAVPVYAFSVTPGVTTCYLRVGMTGGPTPKRLQNNLAIQFRSDAYSPMFPFPDVPFAGDFLRYWPMHTMQFEANAAVVGNVDLEIIVRCSAAFTP